MSRHVPPDPEADDTRLTVPATVDCHARSVALPADGRPSLVVDYGGFELAFEMWDPRVGERFAVGLAFAALCFASNCRYAASAHQQPVEDGES
ncbi:hypothetical protein [Actinophytocola sediminis]